MSTWMRPGSCMMRCKRPARRPASRGWLSPGGLDSTIISYMLRDHRLPAIAVISRDFVATDLTYCQAAAAAMGMRLSVAMPDAAELLEGVSETVRILGCFGESTIRNALVMYVAISEAKRMGIGSLATGDGADELFAGYGFLVRADPAVLRAELDRPPRHNALFVMYHRREPGGPYRVAVPPPRRGAGGLESVAGPAGRGVMGAPRRAS